MPRKVNKMKTQTYGSIAQKLEERAFPNARKSVYDKTPCWIQYGGKWNHVAVKNGTYDVGDTVKVKRFDDGTYAVVRLTEYVKTFAKKTPEAINVFRCVNAEHEALPLRMFAKPNKDTNEVFVTERDSVFPTI